LELHYGGYVGSSPAVADGLVYIGSGDWNLYAFNVSSLSSSPTPTASILPHAAIYAIAAAVAIVAMVAFVFVVRKHWKSKTAQ